MSVIQLTNQLYLIATIRMHSAGLEKQHCLINWLINYSWLINRLTTWLKLSRYTIYVEIKTSTNS